MKILQDIGLKDYGRRFVVAQCPECGTCWEMAKHLVLRERVVNCCQLTRHRKFKALEAFESLADKIQSDSEHDFVAMIIPAIYQMHESRAKLFKSDLKRARSFKCGEMKKTVLSTIARDFKIESSFKYC